MKTKNKLAKIILAKTNSLNINLTNVYEIDRLRFIRLIELLEVVYDNNTNEIIGQGKISKIAELEAKIANLTTRIEELEGV
jgi:hypothetical protein